MKVGAFFVHISLSVAIWDKPIKTYAKPREYCHSERSEESQELNISSLDIIRFARGRQKVVCKVLRLFKAVSGEPLEDIFG